MGLSNLIKTGFGLSVGYQLSAMLFTLIGIIFFIPGYILFKKENDAGKKESGLKIVGIILMALGVVVLGGFGLGTLISGINDL